VDEKRDEDEGMWRELNSNSQFSFSAATSSPPSRLYITIEGQCEARRRREDADMAGVKKDMTSSSPLARPSSHSHLFTVG
jgi:hypothetical protein